MFVGANELIFLGQLAQLAVSVALLLMSVKDLLRGENGTTPGLVMLAIGLVVTNLAELFESATIHPMSPSGFFLLPMGVSTYLALTESWHAAAAWLVAAGLWMLGLYVYKANKER